MKQTKLLKDLPKAYGGELLKTRKGRAHGRPLSTTHTMHLVLRSTHAKGNWSFLEPKNKQRIRETLKKFSQKYGIKILSGANVGNHLHIQFKLANRNTYKPFIRAITSAIAIRITGVGRWKSKEQLGIKSFWDRRPFTRVVLGLKGYLGLQNYIEINRLESRGFKREVARMIVHARFQPLGP